jgi:hypothetical protein
MTVLPIVTKYTYHRRTGHFEHYRVKTTKKEVKCIYNGVEHLNKNFREELIRLLSLHKLIKNDLVAMVTMEHENPNTAEQGSPNKFEPQF